MSKIKLYSTSCPKCKALELKLKKLGVEFEIIEDIAKVIKIGEEHKINSAPILEVDGNFLDFSLAIKYLNERK